MSKKQNSNHKWIFGLHAVEAVLTSGKRQIFELIMVDRHFTKIQHLTENVNKVRHTNTRELDGMFPDENHQGIAVKVASLKQVDLYDILPTAKRLLILDQITDPHNVGACLRSADAFGCDGVILPKRASSPATETVAKIACGALETVPLIYTGNLNSALAQIKEAGFWITGLDGTADKSIADTDLSGKVAIVMGSEGAGIRDLVRKNCDYIAKIPMEGTVESLNVSVSAGIALYEVLRQQLG